MKKKNPRLKTYRLDVSAQFYPIISTRRAQSLFRLSAVMENTVDPELLRSAAEDVLKRFPTFKVRLRKGYAWYYFEENTAAVKVFPSTGRLLRPIDTRETDGYLFRIAYEGEKIEFEVFHAVCDGMAALEFLKALVWRYAVLSGAPVEGREGVADLNAEPSDEEAEDAFYRYYRPIRFGDVDLKGLMGEIPLLLPGTIAEDGYGGTYCGVSAQAVAAKAKEMGASFTSLICGALAYTIEKLSGGRRAVIIMVPVNLRAMFPSKTLRNFVNFVRLTFKPRECGAIADYVRSAAAQLREKATKEEMEKFFATTVRTERSLPMRISPLWFKILMARIGRFFLKSRQTMIFSNVGRVVMPKGCGLKRILFNLNVSKTSKVNVGAVTLDGETTVSFTRSINETELETEFFRTLTQLGIEARPVDVC